MHTYALQDIQKRTSIYEKSHLCYTNANIGTNTHTHIHTQTHCTSRTRMNITYHTHKHTHGCGHSSMTSHPPQLLLSVDHQPGDQHRGMISYDPSEGSQRETECKNRNAHTHTHTHTRTHTHTQSGERRRGVRKQEWRGNWI